MDADRVPPGPARAALGLKVLVDLGHVLHHALPVRPVGVQHLAELQAGFNTNTFSCFKCQQEISFLLLTVQLLVRDVSGQIGVQEGTEGQAVAPAAAEIGDIDVRVTFRLLLAPLQQSVALGAAVFPGQGGQGVSSFHTEFALRLPAPGGGAQQSRAPEAQRRGSAQRLEGRALAEERVRLQVLGPSLQEIREGQVREIQALARSFAGRPGAAEG